MYQTETMKILSKKGTNAGRDWGKILKSDMKLRKKDNKNTLSKKKDILKESIKKVK